MIGFNQPACYESNVNKPNFRNINEENVHRLDFNLSEHSDFHLKWCESRYTTIPVSTSGANFNMMQNNVIPFYVVCFVSKCPT